MKFQLYKQVALTRDILEHGLRRGDVSGRTGLSCRGLRSYGLPRLSDGVHTEVLQQVSIVREP